ncbi:carboxymuconolactone decarboxylase family protein [Mucilaginibacter paludis]|uniref:Alkylhydroperoxidase like protein, AhpD family n=1 Tax=Mucilaginibacter paludis DSM 18603 TaxID=714943 RepID=H1Y103_9SPHI|nr:carboxymuconolactone decarboxylase family protein [Mucilaginibacter paludis]EHQ29228.1 alkylhydroperoxidase like protein, AhpD family [Mucilaginibacter paludis DSM 18603]
MSNRINIAKLEPAAYQAMMGLENYLGHTSLKPAHKELIKIRASQINGCAYCINMHTREARHAGETEQRIYALSAWRDAPYFSEEEEAILALTEEVTLITQRVSDETYLRAASLFDEHYLAQIIMAIVAINAWNRISVSTRLEPEK